MDNDSSPVKTALDKLLAKGDITVKASNQLTEEMIESFKKVAAAYGIDTWPQIAFMVQAAAANFEVSILTSLADKDLMPQGYVDEAAEGRRTDLFRSTLEKYKQKKAEGPSGPN
jgi:hypothetical protein